MKTILSIVMAALACVGLTGCTGAGLANSIMAAGNDNAMVQVIYGGVYGPIRVTRLNPKAGQTYNVNIDGSVTVGWVGSTNLTLKSP